VPYDVDACCAKIEKAGASAGLADRLRVGKRRSLSRARR